MPAMIPRQPRLVVFDLMGTLLAVHNRRPYWEGLGQYLEQKGYCSGAVFGERYSAWRQSRAPSLKEELLRECIARFVAATEADLQELEALYFQEYAEGTTIVPGVQAMLERLRGRAVLGVVSNFFVAGMPRALLRAHQLLDHFDFVIDSAQVGFRKPSRVIFEHAAASVSPGLDPSEILMIGDAWDADVQGALALGWRALHFGESAQSVGRVPKLRTWDELQLE